ncbi:hypothetical protein V6N12_074814 [Hibiscus sabdariffa]|uniref:Uncharacterized protein n=1 Tax=Hibiscus sabdariffa TaxID=183260 RepID=A0ABR2D592_9ROSI
MRVLAKEMAAAGLDGFEIMWVAGSMVLLAFPDANLRQRLLSQYVLSTWFGRLEEWSTSAEYVSRRQVFTGQCGHGGPTSFERARILIETTVRGRIDEVVEVASLGTMFPIVVQEVELVWVSTVEQRGVVDGATLSEQSQEASMASPWKNSPVEQVGDDSPHWHVNLLWKIESAQKDRGASMVVGGVSDCVVCDRGGICSDGDANFAFTGIHSREGLDIVHPSVSIVKRDSLGVKVIGDCESAEKYGRVVGVNGEGAPLTTVLGHAGAATAPVIGSSHGGARKVKSVNTLVEALGSPAQKRVIATARSRRGHGRPAKAVL